MSMNVFILTVNQMTICNVKSVREPNSAPQPSFVASYYLIIIIKFRSHQLLSHGGLMTLCF